MTSVGTVVSSPTPPYSNLPIQPQYYQPSQFFISNVALGTTTIVTTTTNMNYVIGQLVRLLIPPSFGCFQLNGVEAYVISLPSENQVELNINSNQNVSQYIASTNNIQSAQILAVGDVNMGANNLSPSNTGTFVLGSFINISPL